MKRINSMPFRPNENMSGYFIDSWNTTWSLLKGKYHSYNDIPACSMTDGYKAWYFKGMVHRNNGPARIRIKSDLTEEFWYYGFKAKSKAEWLDSQWRKRIEIKVFL